MSTKLSFFHQKRKDLAIRTGVEVDDELVLERFIPGSEENDAVLLWYIDVRCISEAPLELGPVSARSFFRNAAKPVITGLLSSAEELRAGLDADVWPMKRAIESLPVGVTGEIVCSAMKRITDGELATVLKELAQTWVVTIEQLHETVASA